MVETSMKVFSAFEDERRLFFFSLSMRSSFFHVKGKWIFKDGFMVKLYK